MTSPSIDVRYLAPTKVTTTWCLRAGGRNPRNLGGSIDCVFLCAQNARGIARGLKYSGTEWPRHFGAPCAHDQIFWALSGPAGP